MDLNRILNPDPSPPSSTHAASAAQHDSLPGSTFSPSVSASNPSNLSGTVVPVRKIDNRTRKKPHRSSHLPNAHTHEALLSSTAPHHAPSLPPPPPPPDALTEAAVNMTTKAVIMDLVNATLDNIGYDQLARFAARTTGNRTAATLDYRASHAAGNQSTGQTRWEINAAREDFVPTEIVVRHGWTCFVRKDGAVREGRAR